MKKTTYKSSYEELIADLVQKALLEYKELLQEELGIVIRENDEVAFAS